jgi:hypothetical protein
MQLHLSGRACALAATPCSGGFSDAISLFVTKMEGELPSVMKNSARAFGTDPRVVTTATTANTDVSDRSKHVRRVVMVAPG